jgi:hypothetical protein
MMYSEGDGREPLVHFFFFLYLQLTTCTENNRTIDRARDTDCLEPQVSMTPAPTQTRSERQSKGRRRQCRGRLSSVPIAPRTFFIFYLSTIDYMYQYFAVPPRVHMESTGLHCTLPKVVQPWEGGLESTPLHSTPV